MKLAEELALKHLSPKYNPHQLVTKVGNAPALSYDAVVDAVNEAIERCAAECQKELSECEAIHDQRISWKRVAQRCESRIRDLKWRVDEHSPNH